MRRGNSAGGKSQEIQRARVDNQEDHQQEVVREIQSMTQSEPSSSSQVQTDADSKDESTEGRRRSAGNIK